MTWLQIGTYLVAAAFIMMSIATLLAYRRTGHYGLFMMGMTYGASGGIAIVLVHWWPLVLGYVLVWVLKLLGQDPDKDLGRPPPDQEKK
jgi:hypothetical protein